MIEIFMIKHLPSDHSPRRQEEPSVATKKKKKLKLKFIYLFIYFGRNRRLLSAPRRVI